MNRRRLFLAEPEQRRRSTSTRGRGSARCAGEGAQPVIMGTSETEYRARETTEMTPESKAAATGGTGRAEDRQEIGGHRGEGYQGRERKAEHAMHRQDKQRGATATRQDANVDLRDRHGTLGATWGKARLERSPIAWGTEADERERSRDKGRGRGMKNRVERARDRKKGGLTACTEDRQAQRGGRERQIGCLSQIKTRTRDGAEGKDRQSGKPRISRRQGKWGREVCQRTHEAKAGTERRRRTRTRESVKGREARAGTRARARTQRTGLLRE